VAPDIVQPPSIDPSPIRVVIVSDVRLYREGIVAALSRSQRIAIAGTASSAAEVVDYVRRVDANVVVFDMATRGSLDGVRALAAGAPHCRTIAFAVEEIDMQIVACAEAGIAGFVPCHASVDDLTAVIESVCREESPCSPRITATLLRRLAALAVETNCYPGGGASLSRREQEILALLRQGLSNKDIARQLVIEVATVKNHVHNVLTKMGVSTRAEAAGQHHAALTRSRGSSRPDVSGARPRRPIVRDSDRR
jgi:two-component system, NarL family, nitrate/nitrite response regulator NarL